MKAMNYVYRKRKTSRLSEIAGTKVGLSFVLALSKADGFYLMETSCFVIDSLQGPPTYMTSLHLSYKSIYRLPKYSVVSQT